MIALQTLPSKLEFTLLDQHKSNLFTQSIRCGVRPPGKRVEVLESAIGLCPIEKHAKRGLGEPTALKSLQNHPSGFMDELTFPVCLPDSERADGTGRSIGHDRQPPLSPLEVADTLPVQGLHFFRRDRIIDLFHHFRVTFDR